MDRTPTAPTLVDRTTLDGSTSTATATLRLAVWNANMALHRKLPVLADRLNPDIAIVPECANEEILRRKGRSAQPDVSMVWRGRSPNKGLAVFGFGDYEVTLADCYDDRLQWVLPIEVTGPINFALLAVWASNHRGRIQHPDHVGVPQPASALTVYEDWIRNRPTVLAGDFNHNCVWDKPGQGERNHAETVGAATRAGMVSAYHEWFDEPQGKESTPTIYWRSRTLDGPAYHIDYIFMPERWSRAVTDMYVGGFDEWVGGGLSDHVPMLVEVSPHPGGIGSSVGGSDDDDQLSGATGGAHRAPLR